MSIRAEPSSPVMRALQEAGRHGDAAAEEHSWALTAKSGVRPIERIPRDSPHCWFALVFRGNQKVRDVDLCRPRTQLGSIERLERIPGTQVCCRTFRGRSALKEAEAAGGKVLDPKTEIPNFGHFAVMLAPGDGPQRVFQS